jgi:inorganic triphosphatase YgiF
MPHPAPIEIELKFLLGRDAQPSIADHAAPSAPEEMRTLSSTYFDTPGRRLRRGGLALRLRDDGEVLVQTLKQSPGPGGFARGEWERQLPSRRLDLDALAETPAAPILNGDAEDLAPVFLTTVERRTRLCREGSSLIEVAIDVGEIVAGDRHEAIREMELELKRGEPDALFNLAQKLADGADLRLSFESKSERGYRLADDAVMEPRRAAEVALDPGMTAAQVFQALALASLAQASANCEILIQQPRLEALHQLRVAMRRLRTLMKAFEPMLGRGEGLLVGSELKWLAGELDAARDIDVFIAEGFRPAVDALAEQDFAALGAQLLKAQTEAYAKAQGAVRSLRCAALWLKAASWIETGAWTRASDPAAAHARNQTAVDFAVDALDHLRKVVRKRGRRFASLDAKGRHKLRIRAKRMRYAAEFFASLFDQGGGRRRFLKRLKAMQSALGQLNDIAVARSRIPSEAALKAPALTFAAGRVVGWRERDEQARLRAAGKKVHAFCEAAPFWR